MGDGYSGGKGKNLSGGGGVKVTNATDFNSPWEAQDALRWDYMLWEKDLSVAEKESVIRYTGNSYVSINKGLREDRMPARAKLITEALKSFDLRQDIVVHRGMNLDSNEIQKIFGVSEVSKIKTGTIFKDKGFMSTAAGTTGFGGNIKMDIKVPKGKGRGAWVQPISQHKSEYEFLLQRSSNLRIDKIEAEKAPFGKKITYKIIATLIGNDVD